MASVQIKLEQRFFRALNAVVEPAVRRGVLSSRLLPTTLIVLESTGYVSGQARRTPLFCQHLGSHVLISTGRGKRSFWVRNLQRKPDVEYFMGGARLRRQSAGYYCGHTREPATVASSVETTDRLPECHDSKGLVICLAKDTVDKTQ
ncbi:nitroreductase/quinone reductase family protein [Pseudohalioglobus lutimaris]|uniref:Nitroreductase family deazaflavin-dependent oxidoreductase n=1 Tax=Pseudohalioglobus lutimaris TaxID=1737061 RepID=A0A2N5X108_9GAMM|nr:nitroreductase/quinone reductase family protein [Pseudohalioglobus lutimaris]PLW68174.1 hypothetical protein C0039_13350 [Pseudohalioglobus lutimaris]